MALISTAHLEIVGNSIPPVLKVTYTVRATNDDATARRSYQEIVELIGVDIGPGEDGRSEPIEGGKMLDDVITFSTSQETFLREPQKEVPGALLMEDGPFLRGEIRARVSLIPIPPQPVIRSSNLLLRDPPGSLP